MTLASLYNFLWMPSSSYTTFLTLPQATMDILRAFDTCSDKPVEDHCPFESKNIEENTTFYCKHTARKERDESRVWSVDVAVYQVKAVYLWLVPRSPFSRHVRGSLYSRPSLLRHNCMLYYSAGYEPICTTAVQNADPLTLFTMS